MQEMFFEGFKSNTLSSNNYKAVYGANIRSSSSGSTNKSSSKEYEEDNGHWITLKNGNHIFIEDEKGGKKSKGSSSKTSSNKMKGKPTGGAASITKEKKEKEKKKISLFDRRKDKKEDKKSEKNEDKRPYSAEYKLTEEEMKAYKNSDDELSDKLYPISNLIKKEEEKNFESIETKIKNKKKEDETRNTSQKKWSMPCDGIIVGHYGEQRSDHVHNGIDIAVPTGTPVKAIADGIVYYAGDNDPRGYGKYVIIIHKIDGKIITSEYGHLSSWDVSAGQEIKQGQVIAKSGNTGHSEGPHVHLTVREGNYKGRAINPDKYINY